MSNSPSPPRFSTIGLIGNAANAQLTATLAPLVAYLDRRGRRILLDERCEATNPDPKIPLMARSELARWRPFVAAGVRWQALLCRPAV